MFPTPVPVTVQTERTNGAVKVVSPILIPMNCNTTDNNIESVAYVAPFQVLSPKAMAHNTPLYPISPSFIPTNATPEAGS